ncbi:hypothetical protein [Leptospira interrogans]|uniref:Uncharacterized protein n=3 Tax=Leptospira interrogans TaxID=173 RepID=M3GU60_LEPIR|nr:hypothetical protein [Leptospira interrogans]EMG10178.1 hypothetical protein LEP1GSC151_0450 [Leptospira interrogans serovar Grippotyphosa str. LT2186]EMN72593.1 hypothetical protein LEP1GSC100_1471 [Leptospira interrogans serovar Bataviae str. UI 08561]EKO24631.1 hypothetical protein LEP1GSC104_2085 [Leptospira interrogans str. UI 12621]EKR47013.1 hypothetical protein LEP1GSC097_0326 [Leptospira interrogans serovar Grippotyphosa str. UI 08368]EMN52270.1 hypothetical protein LEP1GSC089_0978
MAIRSNKEKEESKVFPRWLAQTLSQNLNIKYDYFLRERRKANVWISWGKAAENSCKSLLTFITQFKYIKIKEDPHWKFRAIYASSLINKVARSLTGHARVEFISKFLNHFARKKELYDPISPVQLRMVHLETNRLTCYARDLDPLAKRSEPKTWVSAARRNYLRMLRTDFTNPEREFSGWDLCFRNNRAKLHRFETDLWDRCFEKNRKRMERIGKDLAGE